MPVPGSHKSLDSGMHSRVDTVHGETRRRRNAAFRGLAKATGVSPDTIRHYEKIGILPKASRTEAGYRLYPGSAVERVFVVQRGLRLGFTLAELAEVLKARDAGGTPCQRVYRLAKGKLEDVSADIEALKKTEKISQASLVGLGTPHAANPIWTTRQPAALAHRGGTREAYSGSIWEEKTMKILVTVFLFCGLNWRRRTCSPARCTGHMNGSQRQADVEKRGDEAMGFPHDRTTHHFRLLPDGGAIEVTVNDSKDGEDLQAIRSHLSHIATMFSNGTSPSPCSCTARFHPA